MSSRWGAETGVQREIVKDVLEFVACGATEQSDGSDSGFRHCSKAWIARVLDHRLAQIA